MFEARKPLKENKRTKARLWSKLSFHYLGSFFALGRQRPLVFRDFWELDDSDRAVNQIDRLEKEWKVELTKENPSLSKAVFRANKWHILPCCFIQIYLLSTRLVVAFITQPLLEWLVLGRTDNSVYIWVGLLALATCSRTFFLHYLLEFEEIVSHRMRVQLNTLVYQKILRLSLNGYNQTTIGTIINYIANDTMFYERAMMMLCFFVGTPIMTRSLSLYFVHNSCKSSY